MRYTVMTVSLWSIDRRPAPLTAFRTRQAGGLPEMACLTVRSGGLDHEYCAPLRVTDDASGGSEPGTVTVSLDNLEGFEGLAVDALVLPSPDDAGDELDMIGGIRFGVIDVDPFSTSEMLHPGGWNSIPDETVIFEPGTYRFIIEAYVPAGATFYGCEMPVQVVESEPLVVTISSLPTYTGSGWHWTPYDELEYPDCPD